MTGDDIKADVQAILVDTGIQWSEANLLLWINAGGRDIATFKPKATTLRQDITLAANVTKQALPAGAIQVLDLTCNMGADGATPGRAITVVAADRLAAARPGWRGDKGDVVKHLVIDDRDPKAFIVWPAPKTALHVEGLVHNQFTPITALAQTISLDDSYRNALGEYVLHCAYAMEGEDIDVGLSAAHYAKYAQIIGIQIKQQKRASAAANSAEAPTYPANDKAGA